LERIQSRLGLSNGEVSATQRTIARYRLLDEIQQGHLPIVSVDGLHLQRGEIAH